MKVTNLVGGLIVKKFNTYSDTYSVVVFDVDNTLVKGNLTLFFLKYLIRERFYFFRRCFVTLVKGAFLLLWRLPNKTKKILKQKGAGPFYGNVYLLDRYLYKSIKSFYISLSRSLNKLDLLDRQLKDKAKKVFSKNFFKKHLYRTGIEKIEQHLQDTNTIVVLLSGSPQELVDVLFESICKELDKKGVSPCKGASPCEGANWQNRFFIKGTVLGPRGEDIRPCIGSEKNKMLKVLLENNGYYSYVISKIYSDNTFMADLPLFIESKNGGMLICEKNSLYTALPEGLIKKFVFWPYWRKV